jgi:hypothetical protein
VFVCKAYPPVHIRICAGGCNAVDGRKDKQDGVFISLKMLIIQHSVNQVHRQGSGRNSEHGDGLRGFT